MNAVEEIFRDTIRKHRIEEQYPKITHPGPHNLIWRMCQKVIEKLRSGDKLQDMHMALSMVHDMPEYAQFYKNDHTIKLAVESVVINALWRYVEVEGFIKSPLALLEKWSNFEKERSHWWRARKAAETDDNIQNKWENLLQDIVPLLNFHNAMLHAQKMLEKPTLKHTLHLAAMTAEGRIYENGQGRSIASECRHILVRTQCDIPIKSRPERKSADTAGLTQKKPKAPKAERKPERRTLFEPDPNEFSYEPYSFIGPSLGTKRTRQQSQLGSAYHQHMADPASRMEDANILLGLGRVPATRTPSDRVEAILASQRKPTEGGSSFGVPMLQRQSSAEEWGQTLGFLGRGRSQYGSNNVPEFSSDMLTSIRKYADGSLREPQQAPGLRPSLLAPTPTEFQYAAASSSSAKSPTPALIEGSPREHALGLLSRSSPDPVPLSRDSTGGSLGGSDLLGLMPLRRQGSAEWPHHLNENATSAPVMEGQENLFDSAEATPREPPQRQQAVATRM